MRNCDSKSSNFTNQPSEETLDLDEDGDGAAGVVDGDGDRAQRHLGPRGVVNVLPESTLHSVSASTDN